MSKILIRKNSDRLDAILPRATMFISKFQSLYDTLNSGGLVDSFENIKKFVYDDIFKSRNNQKNDYNREAEVINALKIIIAENNNSLSSTFGFSIKREKLLEMIDPDQSIVDNIVDVLNWFNVDDIDLFQYLTFNSTTKIVGLTSNYESSITDKYSVYADTQRQVNLVGALNSIITGLNSYREVTNDPKFEADIPGLQLGTNLEFIIDAHFVKKY